MNDDYYSNPNDPASPYSPQGEVNNPFAAAPEESPFTAEQLRQHLNSGSLGDGEKKKGKLKLVIIAIAVLAVMAALMMVMGVFSSSEPDFNAGGVNDGLSMSGSEPVPAAPAADGAIPAPVEAEVPFAPPADSMAPAADGAVPAMDGVIPAAPDAAAPADATPAAPADPFAPLDQGASPVPAAPDAATPAPDVASTSGASAAAAMDDFATKCATKFNDDIKARGQNPDQYPTARDDYVKNCVEYLSKQAKPQ